MRILYNSVHSILEADELTLLTELGHDVFSLGAYSNGGKGHYLLPRPAIEGMTHYPEWEEIGRTHPRTNLPQEFFEHFDVIINMHQPEFLNENWEKMKHKKVIWRTIGQSTPHVENIIRHMRYDGLKIIRMSPMEENITGYVGSDALIRFFKDPDEWKDWTGQEKRAINMTQSIKGRRLHCHYDAILGMLNGFPYLIYGSGNDDLGASNGGDLPYTLMQGALRDNRCFVYGGTWPSPVTLSFIEAWMSGIPVICIGQHLAEDIVPEPDRINYYEPPHIISNGINGFISDNINELREYVHQLLEDPQLAKKIGDEGRRSAIKLYGKEEIKNQWKTFLESL